MNWPSSLINNQRTLVLDTSVLINLHACTYGEKILSVIPNGIIVPQVVADELEHETSHKNGENNFLHKLVVDGKVTLSNMTDEEYEVFHQLIANPPSIDDGEAATVAIASKRNLFPVIDEKRGRTRACDIMQSLVPAWSLDLLCHPLVTATLGDKDAVEALHLALRNGRMRVPSESVECVIAVIGMERAIECICLPGYRERFSSVHNDSTV